MSGSDVQIFEGVGILM